MNIENRTKSGLRLRAGLSGTGRPPVIKIYFTISRDSALFKGSQQLDGCDSVLEGEHLKFGGVGI